MINWNDIRKQFPVTETSTYLNAAAAGPLSRATSRAASEYYRLMMEDGDIHWDDWLEQRQEVRRKVAAFINAEPDEVGLTTNTSSGMNVIVDALRDPRRSDLVRSGVSRFHDSVDAPRNSSATGEVR